MIVALGVCFRSNVAGSAKRKTSERTVVEQGYTVGATAELAVERGIEVARRAIEFGQYADSARRERSLRELERYNIMQYARTKLQLKPCAIVIDHTYCEAQ